MYPLFDLPRRLFRVFSCWPDDEEWSIKRKLFVSLTFTNHVVAMFFEFKYVFEKFNNPLEAFDAVNPTITKFITFFKLCTIIYYRKEFKYNHDQIRSYFDKDHQGAYQDIVLKATRSAYRYCLFTFAGGFFTNFCFFLRPMANNLVQFIIGGNYSRDIPFKASIPLDLSQDPTYQIVYALFSYSGLLTCFGFSAVDGIIMAYCKYISAQFDIISHQLKTHFDTETDDSHIPFTEKQMEVFSRKLRSLVKHHNELILRIAELSRIIVPIILVHFVSSALSIGLSLIDFIMLKGFATILYLIYALVVLLQLLVYCIGGTCVTYAAHGIRDSAYFVKWYRFNSRIRKDILMLMIVSSKERALRVPFFTPSLPAYRAILSAAMSYLTILQSFFQEG